MSSWPRTFGQVPLADIRPRQFARFHLEDLTDLSRHIMKHGQQVPIIIDAGYEVVDGARRLEVARKQGASAIACVATGNYATIVEHLLATTDFQRDHELPTQVWHPRDVYEMSQLLWRLHVLHTRQQGKKSPIRTFEGFNEIIAAISGHPVHLIGKFKSVYSMQSRISTLNTATASKLLEQITKWETQWPDVKSASGLKTRLYETIRTGSVPPIRSHKAKPRIGAPEQALSPKDQIASFRTTLMVLRGGLSGLANIRIDPGISVAELQEWRSEIAELAVFFNAIRTNVRNAVYDGTSTQSSEESSS